MAATAAAATPSSPINKTPSVEKGEKGSGGAGAAPSGLDVAPPLKLEKTPIILVSKGNGQVVISDRNFVTTSKLMHTALENDQKVDQLPVPGVTTEILELVAKYMEHHKGVEQKLIEKPLRSKVMKDVCSDPWDAKFIDEVGEKRQQLYDLILAANYLDIRCLLHLGCAKVASLIKGQPLEKVKEILDPKQGAGTTTASAVMATTGTATGPAPSSSSSSSPPSSSSTTAPMNTG